MISRILKTIADIQCIEIADVYHTYKKICNHSLDETVKYYEKQEVITDSIFKMVLQERDAEQKLKEA